MTGSCIERPILFSGAMVRAILDGSKTQSRRVVTSRMKQWKDCNLHQIVRSWDHVGPLYWQSILTDGMKGVEVQCPYGKVGDRLWVREAWTKWDFKVIPEPTAYFYRANEEQPSLVKVEGLKWKPSIHMPREACRILLEVTEVRIERLQSISEEDAIAEGISKDEWFGLITVRQDYQKLWDSINGDKHPWSSNPWVWVIAFQKVEEVQSS